MTNQVVPRRYWSTHMEVRTHQLTDGGPTVTAELPAGIAGPPFGVAPGWAAFSFLVWAFLARIFRRVQSKKAKWKTVTKGMAAA